MRGPALSALLAPLVPSGIGSGLDFRAVNFAIGLWGVACVVLVYVYQRARLGWVLAVFVALLVWVLPGFQTLCTQVMSDVPGAALLVACLLVERWSARSKSVLRELALGACIGLSVYMRGSLFLLVPAVAVSRLVHRKRAGEQPWRSFAWRRVGLFSVVAVLAVLPWSIRNRVEAPEAPVDQTLQYSVGTIYWHRDAADPGSARHGAGEVLARVPERAVETVQALGRLPETTRAEPPSDADGRRAVLALVLLASGRLGDAWLELAHAPTVAHHPDEQAAVGEPVARRHAPVDLLVAVLEVVAHAEGQDDQIRVELRALQLPQPQLEAWAHAPDPQVDQQILNIVMRALY